MFVVVCLASVIAGVSNYAPADATKDVVKQILSHRHYAKDQEAAVCKALCDAAAKDPSLKKALIFSGSANAVSDAMNARKWDIIETTMNDTSGIIGGMLGMMDQYYQGDGVLAGVKYKEMAHVPVKTWCDFANLGVEEDAFKYIDKYVEFRKQGLNSVEAHEKISRLNYAWAWNGADKLFRSLEGFGKLTLTGYSAADTHADMPLFLESYYAFASKNGEKGIRAADCTRNFMAHKLFAVLKKDYARVMIPVNRIIDRELSKFEKPTAIPPSSGPATDKSDSQFGMPGKLKDSGAWIRGIIQPDGNLPNHYVRIGSDYVWQMESPASVDAGQIGATAFNISTPGLSVQPGEEYEVMFMPWVNTKCVTFMPGNPPSTNSSDAREVSIGGDTATVYLHVRVKSYGQLQFKLFASRKYLLALGEVYVRKLK